jgi:cytoskeleton protein RodZ
MIEPVRSDAHEFSAEPEQAGASPTGPGALLGDERRRQGLSLGDIARQLKLSVRQIEALERDDYAMFSGMVFVRGFLRNYAKLLQLDPDALLAQLSGSSQAAAPAPEAAAAQPVVALPRRAGRPGMGLLGGAAVLAVLVVAALYEGRQHTTRIPTPAPGPAPQTGLTNPQHPDSPPAGLTAAAPPAASADPAQPATAAVPEAGSAGGVPAAQAPSAPSAPMLADAPVANAALPAPPAAAPTPVAAASAGAPVPPTTSAGPAAMAAASGEPRQLRLKFQAEAWVEVRDASGTVIFSQLGSPGSERVLQGRAPLQVVVGNAHAVQVTYQGRLVDLAPHTRVDVARLVLE